MPDDLPIVCSLTATELPLRLAEIADVGRAALLETQCEGAHARLRFAAAAGLRERLAAIATAEALCCAFLELRVEEERDAVVLTIDGPDGAAVVVVDLVRAFRGEFA